MPTRLVVLLHRRKSASARVGVSATVAATRKPPNRTPTERVRDWSIMVRRSLIIPLNGRARISRAGSSAVNEASPKIVDVGVGWPRYQQVVQFSEEFGRIVVIKKDGRIEAQLAGPTQCRSVEQGACRILWLAGPAIGSVRVGGEPHDPGRPAQRLCQG